MLNQIFAPKGKSVNFKSLPPDIQNNLLQLQSPAADCLFFKTSISRFDWICLLVSAGWLIYLVNACYDRVWSDWEFWIYCAVTLIVIAAMFLTVFKIFTIFSAKIKNGFIFAKDECYKITGNLIEFWNLKEIELLIFKEFDKKVEFWVGNKKESFAVKNPNFGSTLEKGFNDIKLNAGEGLLTKYISAGNVGNKSSLPLMLKAVLLISLVAGGSIFYFASRLNNDFNDTVDWKQALLGENAGDLINFRLTHPKSGHLNEAGQKINELIEKQTKKNQDNPENYPKGEAVKALNTMIENIEKNPDKTLYIKVTETRDLNDSIISEIIKRAQVNINPFSSVIPTNAEAEKRRKDKLFNDVKGLFFRLLENSEIKVEDAGTNTPQTPFVAVDYKMKSFLGYFGMTTGKTPLEASFKQPGDYYPIVSFDFDMSLNGNGSANLYQTNDSFTLKNFSFEYDEKHPDQTLSVLYFNKHSETFAADMKRHFGLR